MLILYGYGASSTRPAFKFVCLYKLHFISTRTKTQNTTTVCLNIFCKCWRRKTNTIHQLPFVCCISICQSYWHRVKESRYQYKILYQKEQERNTDAKLSQIGDSTCLPIEKVLFI